MADLDRTGWTATASSQYSASTGPDKALDGIDSTASFWCSGVGFPQSIQVDMGSAQTISYIRYRGAWSWLTAPIIWGQQVPSYVRAEVSLDGASWTEVALQVWPICTPYTLNPPENREQWVYFAPVSARHFRLTGLDDWGRDGYHRMACSEIYAGLLDEGQPCKYYWHARPQDFVDQFPLTAKSFGDIEFNTRGGSGKLCPPFLTVEAAVRQLVWVHHTSPLGWYPECVAGNYRFPPGWLEDTPVPESVSVVHEGEFAIASNNPPMSCDLQLSFNWGSNQSYFDFIVGWFLGIQIERTLPRVATFWSLPDNPLSHIHLSNIADLVMHHWIWHSLPGAAPETAYPGDVSWLNTTDAYLLIVWRTTHNPDFMPGEGEEPPPVGRPGYGENNAMLLIDLEEERPKLAYLDGPEKLPEYD